MLSHLNISPAVSHTLPHVHTRQPPALGHDGVGADEVLAERVRRGGRPPVLRPRQQGASDHFDRGHLVLRGVLEVQRAEGGGLEVLELRGRDDPR